MTDPSPELRLEIAGTPADGYVVLVAGDIDLATAGQLHDRLHALGLAAAVGVVVDLSAVSFIDSSGIHALLASARAIAATGGLLVLAAPSPAVQRLFELVNVAEVVAVEPDRETAIARSRRDTANRGDE